MIHRINLINLFFNLKKNHPNHHQQSLQDKKLHALATLKEVSSRIDDAANNLSNIHGILSSPQNGRSQKAEISSLQKTLVSFLKNSSSEVSSSAYIVSPFAGLKYLHQRKEQRQNKKS